jgi:hypothetical protein
MFDSADVLPAGGGAARDAIWHPGDMPAGWPEPITAVGRETRMSDDQGETRLRRRSVVVRVAAVGTAAVGLGGCVVVPAAPVRPVQVRTGMSDADPSDGPGRGR